MYSCCSMIDIFRRKGTVEDAWLGKSLIKGFPSEGSMRRLTPVFHVAASEGSTDERFMLLTKLVSRVPQYCCLHKFSTEKLFFVLIGVDS